MTVTNLRMLRTLHNKSQKDIARKIDVSPTYISMLEGGKVTPGKETSKKLEMIFDKPISHLLRKAEC